jgi:hypothetical protein
VPEFRPSSTSALEGLTLEVVEWLSSGSEKGLVRVRARWAPDAKRPAGLPALCARGVAGVERFESLPDAPVGREGGVWRGAYLAPAHALRGELWLQWEGGERSALPLPAGLEDAEPGAPQRPEPEPEPGGEVIDRAVMAERRARRAEASEQAQARVATEALRAVEALELRGGELEERATALAAERDRLAEQLRTLETAPPAADPEVAARDEHRRRALADARGAAARARMQAREWRLQMRTAEIARSSDAVRLRVVEGQQLAARPLRAELDRRVAELEDERRRGEELAAELGHAREQAVSAATALDEARRDFARRLAEEQAEHESDRTALASERGAHEETRRRLAESESELAQTRAELDQVRGQLAAAREEAAGFEAALAAERAARVAVGADLETARTAAAAAEAGLRAEAVARAALDAEIDRERAARTALTVALDRGHSALVGLEADLAAERAARQAERATLDSARAELEQERAAREAEQTSLATLRADLDTERAALAADRSAVVSLRADLDAERTAREADRAALESLRADLDAERAAREAERLSLATLRSELEAARLALTQAEAARVEAQRDEGLLLDRIAELDREAGGLADELMLEQRARWQAEAAAAAAARRAPELEPRRLAADLDAAAAALRARVPAREDDRAEPAAPAAVPEAPGEPAPVEVAPVEPAPVEKAPVAPAPVAPPEPLRPTIVSARGAPPRPHATGESQRTYPWLRGALVKLAHDDPRAAGRVLAGLLPVQDVLVEGAVDYDLTIAEVGTFAVTLAGGRANVVQRDEPRGRREAEFHLSSDALTLAELVAGVPHRIRRFRGPVRISGRRRRLKPLRTIPGAELSFAEAARAGARLDPGLVIGTFPYVIHPAWSRGHLFTVALEIVGDPPETWYVSVGNGAGIKVNSTPPPNGPDAKVTMTREGFEHLLSGEPAPPGHRPAVRGERAAVAALNSWLDRAQGVVHE